MLLCLKSRTVDPPQNSAYLLKRNDQKIMGVKGFYILEKPSCSSQKVPPCCPQDTLNGSPGTQQGGNKYHCVFLAGSLG